MLVANMYDLAKHTLDQHQIIINNGSWNNAQLLESLIDQFGKIESVFITTYSFTETLARQLGILVVDGKIANCHIVLDHKATVRYPNVSQLLCGFSKLQFANIHAKILHVVWANNALPPTTILGSSNWTNNKRVESLIVCLGDDDVISKIQNSFVPCN
jgi:uncharacterized membrane protein